MLEIQLVQWCGDSFVEVDDEHYNVQHGRVRVQYNQSVLCPGQLHQAGRLRKIFPPLPCV